MTDMEQIIKKISNRLRDISWDDIDEHFADYIASVLVNVDGVTIEKETPAVPGHVDQYNIAEMSYNNGYAKGLEDGKKETEKRAKWVTKTAHGVSWTECPVCMVCGSPQWKCCPVCETKMEVSNGD